MPVIMDLEIGLKCPISGELMTDPVLASDGYSYERSAIRKLFDEAETSGKKPISPMTAKEFTRTTLVSNTSLKIAVQLHQMAAQTQETQGILQVKLITEQLAEEQAAVLKKAEEIKELKEKLEGLEQEKIGEKTALLKTKQEALDALQKIIDEKIQELDKIHAAQLDTQKRLEASNQEILQHQKTVGKLQGDLLEQTQRYQTAELVQQQLTESLKNTQQQLADKTLVLKALETQQSALEAQLKSMGSEDTTVKTALLEAQQKLAQERTASNALKETLSAQEKRIQESQQQAQDAQAALKRMQQALDSQTQQLSSLSSQASKAREEAEQAHLKALEALHKKMEQAVSGLNQDNQHLKTALSNAQSQHEAVQKQLSEVQGELTKKREALKGYIDLQQAFTLQQEQLKTMTKQSQRSESEVQKLKLALLDQEKLLKTQEESLRSKVNQEEKQAKQVSELLEKSLLEQDQNKKRLAELLEKTKAFPVIKSRILVNGNVQSGFISSGRVRIQGDANFGNTMTCPSNLTQAKSPSDTPRKLPSNPKDIELLKKLKKAISLGYDLTKDAEDYYEVLAKHGIGFQKMQGSYQLVANKPLDKTQAIQTLSQLLVQLESPASPNKPNTQLGAGAIQIGGGVSQGFVSTDSVNIGGHANFGNKAVSRP